MTETRLRPEQPFAVVLNFNAVALTDEQFRVLRQKNDDLHLEVTAQRELMTTATTRATLGSLEEDIVTLISSWARYFGTGPTFDSSAVFRLPNGARRSPVAAWVRRDRWEVLTSEERGAVFPLCPDFVLEVRPSGFRLPFFQDKMDEYTANGTQLALLVDPEFKQLYVYRPSAAVEILDSPFTFNGEPEMPGFVLDFNLIW